jgi:hypothetical protein
MKKYDTTNANTYRGYSINTADGKYDCSTAILDKYLDSLEYMLNKHSKVLQTRFDVRIPQHSAITLEQLQRFPEYLKRNLQRNNPLPQEGRVRSTGKNNCKNQVDPHIIRVTERTSADNNPHQHYVVLVNGNAKQSGWDIQQRAQHELANATRLTPDQVQGMIHFCNTSKDKNAPHKKMPSFYMLDRNAEDFQQKLDQAVHQGSYLAKTRSKEHTPKGKWTVSATRLPKNNPTT